MSMPRIPAPVLLFVCLAACSGQSRDGPTARDPPASERVEGAAAQVSSYDSLFTVAEAIHFSGEYDSALVLLERIHEQARREGNVAAEARALTWIGIAHWRLGDHAEARRTGEAALSLKHRHSLTDQYFRSYNALGLQAWIESRLTEAERLYQLAITVSRERGDRRNEATARGNLALVQTDLGQFREARGGFQEMQATMAELGDARLEGNALTNLGMLEIRVGSPKAALPLLQQALARYQSINYGTGIQSALGQLGTAYTALGEPAEAFAVLDSAFALATDQGLRQEQASILEATAELYRAAGDFPRALEMYDRARRINADLDLALETGVDMRGEADIHVTLGDLNGARGSALEALTIHRAAGAPLEVLSDLLVLAEILDRLGDPGGVERTLAEARSLAPELGARIARVELGLTEARISDRHRYSREVLAAIQRIEPDLARGGYDAEWEARLLESRALERLGRTAEAAAAGRRALATVERVRGKFGSGVLRTAFVAGKGEVYAHLIAVLLRLGEVNEAFEVADAARGRALLERLPSAGHEAMAADGPAHTSALSDGELLLSEIDRLVESIDYIEETPPGGLTLEESRELALLYDRLKRARREYEGLLVQVAESNRDATAFLGGALTDAGAVRSALGPGQLVVEYFVPPEGAVVVFLLSRDQVHALESPLGAHNLLSRVRLARDLMVRDDESGERLDRVLQGLHEALIEPLLKAGLLSEAGELMIVPHRALVYLPFAALQDRTTGRYLVEDFTLRVLPTAAALPVLSQRSSQSERLTTASVFAPFPGRLPATRLELDAVTAGSGGVGRYAGSRATEAAVRQALNRPGLVHLATHGVLNAHNPMFSRLELARNNGSSSLDDGRLEVHELLSLPIQAQLVFLSGCETGVGAAYSTAFVQGDDYATLAQAFLHAGAGSVIATLWPVQDVGAAAFAELFYRHLRGGSPALALARAQRAMLHQARYRAPYYWATYQLAGYEGRREAHIRAGASVPIEERQSRGLPSVRP
jgi:CHAT domain-containing protein